jgi:Cu2+-containing amine oxidase
LQPFEANNVISPGYVEPTMPPETTCDHPGTDAGTFAGVAVEKGGSQLVLTTQMSAGWYRYTQKWILHPDGTIDTRFGFSAVDNPCTSKRHNHHAYRRLDFDIDGATNDVFEESQCLVQPKGGVSWNPVTVERQESRPVFVPRTWQVRDKVSGRGYRIIPGGQDGVADTWAVADLWFLHHKSNELDDGGATRGAIADSAHLSNYVNSENIDGQDVVLWYHIAHRHAGTLDCVLIGPTLKPFGPW